MENTLKTEKTAAEGSLTGWRKMVSKAVHPETGAMEEDSVKERLKSLDAAWARFDQAHYRLMSSLVDGDKEEEQEDWEKQMEEYCLVKEEGLAALKKVEGIKIKVRFTLCNQPGRSLVNVYVQTT